MKNNLFPAGCKADPDQWDITLLAFVLLHVIDNLPSTVLEGVDELREMKNTKVSHANPTFTHQQFEKIRGKVNITLDKLLAYLEEDDRQAFKDLFNKYSETENIFNEDGLATDAECNEETKSFIDLIEAEKKDSINKILDMLEESPEKQISVTASFTMTVTCPDRDKKEIILNAVIRGFENAPETLHKEIKDLEELAAGLIGKLQIQGAKLQFVEKDSIVLHVQCPTLSSLLAVMDSFISDDTNEILKKISKTLADQFDTHVEIQAVPMKLTQLQTLVGEIEKKTAGEKDRRMQGKRKRKEIARTGLKIPRVQEDTIGEVTEKKTKSKQGPLSPGVHGEIKIEVIDKESSGAMIDKNLYSQYVSSFPRVVCDPIHGHIELSPMCAKIVDTPQFQRLRFIKQLGHCYFVYPGASHNRFEHSLGTCHLGKQLIRALRNRQPELRLDDKDELCVEIAALCHDLGHGPFSHPFEQQYIRQIHPSWKHQMASVDMFEYLIQANDLKNSLQKFGIGEKEISFIKKLIMPQKIPMSPIDGKADEKAFMYEIISNEFNGIDVDKWDYFARDCHMSGIKNSFDHLRCIHFARVIKCPDGRKHICFRDKEASDLYEMYYTRSRLHRWLYQHKVCNTLNFMITDALMLAKSHLTYVGKNGKVFELPDTIDDMTAFSKVNDDVFSKILNLDSDDPKVVKAKQILEDVLSRRLYVMVTKKELKFKYFLLKDALVAKKELLQHYNTVLEKKKGDPRISIIPELCEDDIIVDPVDFDFGKGEENPIDFVWFYSKSNINEARRIPKDQVSFMLPTLFAEQQLRLFCKIKNKTVIELLKEAFSYWCYDRELPGQN